MPSLLRVPAQAIGRGTIEPINILYISALDSCWASRIIGGNRQQEQGRHSSIAGVAWMKCCGLIFVNLRENSRFTVMRLIEMMNGEFMNYLSMYLQCFLI